MMQDCDESVQMMGLRMSSGFRIDRPSPLGENHVILPANKSGAY